MTGTEVHHHLSAGGWGSSKRASKRRRLAPGKFRKFLQGGKMRTFPGISGYFRSRGQPRPTGTGLTTPHSSWDYTARWGLHSAAEADRPPFEVYYRFEGRSKVRSEMYSRVS